MNKKTVTLAYIAIAIITLAAITIAYFFAPTRTFMPALTTIADSIATYKTYKNDTTTQYKQRFPPKKQFLNLELNTTDSTLMIKARGIGPVLSKRIVKYRLQLGGYLKLEQLLEVKGINKDNFPTISKNFWVDTTQIIKINVNFASQNTLEKHPYITPNIARRLIEARKSKGGITNYHQLTNNNILTPGESRKVAPYLNFTN